MPVDKVTTKPPFGGFFMYDTCMDKKTMKNLHLEHPEDMILEGDLTVFDALYSHGNISLKIDGAPSIVFGTNPENGKFFVGTKSVFNKVKNMICYSVDDIFTKYNENTHASLIVVLTHCFLYLPRIDGIVQGDFIGFGGSNIYKPNTLTYHFPELVKQRIIVAPHTFYETDTTMLDAIASPLMTSFADDKDVKWIQPTVDRVYENTQAPRINSDNVNFLTKKEAVAAKKAINLLIKNNIELNDSNLYDILGCNHLVNLYLLVIELKEELMDSFIVYGAPKCVLEGSEIIGEGFVFDGKFKLVKREEFAYANFTQGRFQ